MKYELTGLGQLAVLSVLAAGVLGAGPGSLPADIPILVRAENFTVTPSTGPVTHIRVRNSGAAPVAVTVEPSFPAGWHWTPRQRSLTLGPHQLERPAFVIERAMDVKANQYPVTIAVETDAGRSVSQQTVVCASAPFFKPKIDGRFRDWSEAIPVTFTTAGHKTVVSTYWNQTDFCIYVQVEEDELSSLGKDQTVRDAVQFALAPGQTVTATDPAAPARRYEFLLVNVTGLFAKDRCLQLIRAGTALSVAQQVRTLESLVCREAQVVVKRRGRITHYECAIPWAVMPSIRADVGREICLSLRVHDPDGTGLRDWGQATGLWDEERNALAWCQVGASTDAVPYDSKVEWGLCSSKH